MAVHTTTEKVYDHLEFLGFKLELKKREAGDDYDTCIAKHDIKPNLLVRTSQDVVFIRSMWGGFDIEALKSKHFHTTLNEVNADRVVSKWYYDDSERGELSILAAAVVFGYDKVLFGTFLDGFFNDVVVVGEKLKAYYGLLGPPTKFTTLSPKNTSESVW